MECSYCDKEAVTNVGLSYCEDHLGYFEYNFFENAVAGEFTSRESMEEFFVWAFGSNKPKLSNLAPWHDRIPRPENDPEKQFHRGIYKDSQDDYIKKILKEFRKERRL